MLHFCEALSTGAIASLIMTFYQTSIATKVKQLIITMLWECLSILVRTFAKHLGFVGTEEASLCCRCGGKGEA